MRGYFEGFGQIIGVELVRDPATLEPEGSVLIEFAKTSEGKEAVECLDGMELEGK